MSLLISVELILLVSASGLVVLVLAAVLGRRGKADYELRRGENAKAGSSVHTRPDPQCDQAKPPSTSISVEQERLCAEIAAQQQARIAWQHERSKIPEMENRVDSEAQRGNTEVERALARVRQENARTHFRPVVPQPAAGARLNSASSPLQTLADSVQASYAKVAWAFGALARKLES